MILRFGGYFWRVVIGKPKDRPIFKAIVAKLLGFRGFQLPEKK